MSIDEELLNVRRRQLRAAELRLARARTVVKRLVITEVVLFVSGVVLVLLTAQDWLGYPPIVAAFLAAGAAILATREIEKRRTDVLVAQQAIISLGSGGGFDYL